MIPFHHTHLWRFWTKHLQHSRGSGGFRDPNAQLFRLALYRWATLPNLLFKEVVNFREYRSSYLYDLRSQCGNRNHSVDFADLPFSMNKLAVWSRKRPRTDNLSFTKALLCPLELFWNMSKWQGSNLRPQHPKCRALPNLSYT